MSADNVRFPFTAIVGQEEMKLALLLNVIDSKIGGVMVSGDRGTGKSTTVRALVDVVPEIKVIKEDSFNLHPDQKDLLDLYKLIKKEDLIVTSVKTPMVELPLGATEDRVCGTIDLEKAITEGIKKFEPGLLAKANRGILYVDEINLLDDHLVDVLLDSAASGWNTVEREGVSIRHPARFVLIGSANPEEGELRPQLLDRFGMHVEVKTEKDPSKRVKIVRDRIAFDSDPNVFMQKYKDLQEALKNRIIQAINSLPTIKIEDKFEFKISEVCGKLGIDGLRGDLVTTRAACAYTAFEGQNRLEVSIDDIQKVIFMCLRHRLRKDPLESIGSDVKIKEIFNKVFDQENL